MDKDIRVGDAERHNALDLLSTHFANGLIDINEFEDRTGKAAVARTRSEIASLFEDLPDNPIAEVAPFKESEAQAELDRLQRRGRLVHRIDAVIWSVTMILFFLGLFVLDLNYFFFIFPIAGIASWGVREAVKLSDDDEKLYEELKKKEDKDRAERLRLAAERRKELGQ
ncbi:DUF1707 SHOCT-like domain-containing protein [Corynebacterium striatum]|uniref:DUF1707 SHOCT-like domain-containing protein n=2 Tax=Corynebacterium striatum TaxID=43770 RepID=UPI001A1C4226|nr:DUF1707 domain-containing protein [Corynebacterium striatum]HAT1176077.1 DUF1707 domain-containing protein [Corynebacterium striatum]HAT1184102.1 DUF1707 domain-containing protein [Corynebacterium striatum]HAT1250521.1 DUF1707 domain-containing protein [Corynebacterium striatum]HAT1262925.1 DUF1707 domain-containing protein [Corynebacterium striatum]